MKLMPPIAIEKTYKQPIDEVWKYITNQTYLAQWLMPGNFEPIVGKSYRFDCPPDENECSDFVFGEILDVQAPHTIKFTWNTAQLHNTTVVTFSLVETNDGVTFKIAHEGFAEQDKIECEKHEMGWAHHQNLIEKIVKHEKA
ncbi:MAG: SRPBCC domain-containing protein [Cyclobacteriaceae bacterium]